jgi:transcriptional regulator GlxA family with amidase domain
MNRTIDPRPRRSEGRPRAVDAGGASDAADASDASDTDAAADAATLRAVQHHIAEHLDQDLRLPSLARCAAMSPSCFSRWFRDQMGITPHAYVLEARLERAKSLLRETELPLLEVALAVGFSSQSCLNVAFRRRAGVTPAGYRSRFSTKTKDGADRGVRSSRTRGRARASAR